MINVISWNIAYTKTYVASITTATPEGCIASVIATAICFVSLSCTKK